MLGSEIKRIAKFKNKLDFFGERFIVVVYRDKDALELLYKNIARQLNIFIPIIPAIPSLKDRREKENIKRFLTEIIALSLRELLKEQVLLMAKEIFLNAGIMRFDKETMTTMLSDDYIKDEQMLSDANWDILFTELTKSKIKIITDVMKVDDAILSQILINIASRFPEEKKEDIDRIYALEELIMKEGYEFFLKNRNSIINAELITPSNSTIILEDGRKDEKDKKQ